MPGNKAPEASWLCYCIINRHTFHCMSVGNYRAASNQRFIGITTLHGLHNGAADRCLGDCSQSAFTSWLATLWVWYYSTQGNSRWL